MAAPTGDMSVKLYIEPVLDEEALETFRARLGASLRLPQTVRVLPPESGAPVITLPEAMAREGHQQIRAVTHEWAEVFPGLEAKVAEVVTTGSGGFTTKVGATVLFRLTPDDGQQPERM